MYPKMKIKTLELRRSQIKKKYQRINKKLKKSINFTFLIQKRFNHSLKNNIKSINPLKFWMRIIFSKNRLYDRRLQKFTKMISKKSRK